MRRPIIALVTFLALCGGALAQTPQLVRPCIGTAANCVPVSSAAPMPVTPSAPASGTYVGNVGGFDVEVAVTPTLDAGAYASGDALFDLQTVAFFRSTAQPSGILNNISVVSRGGSVVAMTLYIFTANPSASTCTKNAAFVLNAADVSKLIPTIPIVLTPAVVGVGTTAASASQQLPVSVKNSEAAVNLYVCAVTAGVTPASTSDLIFKFAGVQD